MIRIKNYLLFLFNNSSILSNNCLAIINNIESFGKDNYEQFIKDKQQITKNSRFDILTIEKNNKNIVKDNVDINNKIPNFIPYVNTKSTIKYLINEYSTNETNFKELNHKIYGDVAKNVSS